jgi:hypothetical protein
MGKTEQAGQVSRALEKQHMHMSNGKFAIGFICYFHPFLGFL